MKKAIEETKDRKNSSEEYRRIYTEMMQRMKNLFSQGYTLLTIVGVVWSLAATTLGMFLENGMITFSGESALLSLGLSLVIVILFGLPAIIAFPFAVKHHDNLRAVASLSAYAKAFYEVPAISGESIEEDFCSWETLHCDAGLSRTRFFSSEYIIATLLSIFLSLFFFGVAIFNIIDTKLLQSNPLAIIGFFILAVIYEAVVIFLTVHIFRYSRIIIYIRLYSEQYLDVYLKEAVEIKRATQKQVDDYLEYYDKVSKRDSELSRNLKHEMKILKARIKLEKIQIRSQQNKNKKENKQQAYIEYLKKLKELNQL